MTILTILEKIKHIRPWDYSIWRCSLIMLLWSAILHGNNSVQYNSISYSPHRSQITGDTQCQSNFAPTWMLSISYFTIFSKVGSLVIKKIRLAFYAASRCTQWRYSACCPQSWVACINCLHFCTSWYSACCPQCWVACISCLHFCIWLFA